MLGAIIGDIVGSRFEFNPTNDYNFEFFSPDCDFTDDTICTIAIADALLKQRDFGESLHDWCRRYPNPTGGYGISFRKWVKSDNPQPYNSFGNGAAMRVSPIAWLSLNAIGQMHLAYDAAACTHNHPEGIKGAQAVVSAIHDCLEMHNTCKSINPGTIMQIGLRRAIDDFGYRIDFSLNEVQNRFDETCQGTVPVAFWIIKQSFSFEDAVRRAVSLGADADTLGAIVGSIAEAIWGIPEWMKKKAISYLPSEMRDVLSEFRKACPWKLSGKIKKEHKALEPFLACCRYYKGEGVAIPDSGNNDGLFAGYERAWVFEYSAHYSSPWDWDHEKMPYLGYKEDAAMVEIISFYENVPPSLIALLFNRYMHWGGGYKPIDEERLEFVGWFREKYLKLPS